MIFYLFSPKISSSLPSPPTSYTHFSFLPVECNVFPTIFNVHSSLALTFKNRRSSSSFMQSYTQRLFLPKFVPDILPYQQHGERDHRKNKQQWRQGFPLEHSTFDLPLQSTLPRLMSAQFSNGTHTSTQQMLHIVSHLHSFQHYNPQN